MNTPLLGADVAVDEVAADEAVTWVDNLVELLGLTARHIALLAAWIATCGSLFFSEVLGWRPCLLCWYQRILMYPLAVILAIGIARCDRALPWYVLPFSLAGIGVSLYHYLLIKTDWLPPPSCAVDVPCTVDYIDWFGVINIPFLALTAFLIITCMMLAFAWLQQPLATEADAAELPEATTLAGTTTLIDTAKLAVLMIIVSVVLAFLVGSTFV